MNHHIPPMLAPCAAALDAAIIAEDSAYWGRPSKAEPLVFGWYLDGARVVLHWSAERAVGPRDHDNDQRARLDDIGRRFAFAFGFASDVETHTGDVCGTMQLSFVPVVAS